MATPPPDLDAVLAAVVAEGSRRVAVRRQRRLTAFAAGCLALLAVSAAVAVPRAASRTGADGAGLVAAPVGSPTTAPAVATSAAPPPSPSAPTPIAPVGPGPATTPPPGPKPTTPKPPPPDALVASTSPTDFLGRVRADALKLATPYGLRAGTATVGGPATLAPSATAPAAGPPGTAAPHSGGTSATGTNVQEVDVDEPDVAKLQGDLLLSYAGGQLQVTSVASPTPTPVARFPLPAGATPRSMLVVGRRALLILDRSAEAPLFWPTSEVLVVDLSVPSRPRASANHVLQGRITEARLVAGVARVVLAAPGPAISFAHPEDGSEAAQRRALAENRRRITASTLRQWLPAGFGCDTALHTQATSGLGVTSVRSIDPMADQPGPGTCIVGDARTVYASTRSLYVGTSVLPTNGAVEPAVSLHRFDLADPARARYVASGTVLGTLHSSYSLSEHDGRLRVATTAVVAAVTEGRVSVLEQREDRLVVVGSVGGLGKQEVITGVRFVGDLAYVSTFERRLCDPFFVVDLRDPAKPVVRGSLDVRGRTSYLHPTRPGRVLGVGMDEPGDGRPNVCNLTHPQVRLYDVADPTKPRVRQELLLPQGRSFVEDDPHAFLWWAPADLLALPVVVKEGDGSFGGVVGLRVLDGGITEVGRVQHPGPSAFERAILRSFVKDGRLVTVSRLGVGDVDLATFGALRFSAYPT